jgi:hypothetical protein
LVSEPLPSTDIYCLSELLPDGNEVECIAPDPSSVPAR